MSTPFYFSSRGTLLDSLSSLLHLRVCAIRGHVQIHGRVRSRAWVPSSDEFASTKSCPYTWTWNLPMHCSHCLIATARMNRGEKVMLDFSVSFASTRSTTAQLWATRVPATPLTTILCGPGYQRSLSSRLCDGPGLYLCRQLEWWINRGDVSVVISALTQ